MSVTLTEAAARHVSAFLTKRGKGIGLRLGVKTSGCSGMAYKLEFADVVNEDDQVWESHGVKVVVDAKSLPYIDGTELDYVKEGLQEGFKYNNPQEKNAADAASLSTSKASQWLKTRLRFCRCLLSLRFPKTRWRKPGAGQSLWCIRISLPLALPPNGVWPSSGPVASMKRAMH